MLGSHLTHEGVGDPLQYAQTLLPSAEWPCRSHHPCLAGKVQGAGGERDNLFCHQAWLGKALPALSCALKCLLRATLIPEKAVPLDGSKSVHKNPSLPADTLYHVFMRLLASVFYVQSLNNICKR